MTTKRRVKKQQASTTQVNPVFKHQKHILKPKTLNQAKFMESIENHDLVICEALAGSGKTHISVGMGCRFLEEGIYEQLIIIRPIVPRGRDMGALPGDVGQKIQPYMEPAVQALDYFLTPEKRKELIALKIIKLLPLQYLRGINLHNSFVVLDEMQNATPEDLILLGTRLGRNTKAVFVGDMTQSDLGSYNTSEIKEKFLNKLSDSPEIGFCFLTEADIIRSRIAKIIATKCIL